MKEFFKSKTKMKKGSKVTLKSSTPIGKVSSTNVNMGCGRIFIITRVYNDNGICYDIANQDGVSYGWVYDYETIEYGVTIESLTEDLNEKQIEIDSIRQKIEYLTETGLTEFDETQYKAYTTLKLIDNDKLSMVEKSKIIAKLIKGN